MPPLVTGVYVLNEKRKAVDGRNKSGHGGKLELLPLDRHQNFLAGDGRKAGMKFFPAEL